MNKSDYNESNLSDSFDIKSKIKIKEEPPEPFEEGTCCQKDFICDALKHENRLNEIFDVTRSLQHFSDDSLKFKAIREAKLEENIEASQELNIKKEDLILNSNSYETGIKDHEESSAQRVVPGCSLNESEETILRQLKATQPQKFSLQSQNIASGSKLDFTQHLRAPKCSLAIEKSSRLSITRSSRESKSLAWRLFKVAVDDQSKAICQLCDAKISRGQKVGSFTTSNMLKHLSIKHPQQLQEEEEKAKKEQEKKRTLPLSFLSDKKLKTPTGLGCSKQLTLQETVDKGKTWDVNDVRAQKVHKFIGEMIAIDLQPFSIVEDIGFIRLLNHVCPKYQIPSRKYMKEKIVQDTYDRVRKKIQEEINSANYLSFTSDGWTASSANTSFLSLTAHWISDNYELKSAILRVSPFEGSHTASNISECLKDTLNKFEIPNNKVLVIVRDNAANMAAGVAQAEYESLPCFLRTLQLVLNDAIFEQRYVKDLISVCKQIVGHFNHSPSAFANYADYQKRFDLPPHTFIQDIPTRWNSQYYMLSRVFEQKIGLISYCSDHPKPACLEANQWKILDKLLKILKHFVECTNFLSSREAIASVIIPNIKVICHFFDTAEEKRLFVGLGSTLSALKVSVETRFGTYLKKKILILATYLDPRFKTTFLEDEYENQNVEKIILQWLYDDINSLNISKSSTDDIGLDTSDPSDNDKSENESDFNLSFGSCFSEFKKKKKVVNNVETDVESTADSSNKKMQAKEKKFKETIKIELIKYQDLKTINKDLSPIQWWNMNKDSFPNMAMLAKKYLCAPPSSIESERLFSVGGNIYSPKRNRLKAETEEMLMFLHYNLSVLGFEF